MEYDKTKAFVLNFRPLGELDRILIVFTEAKGKISGIAKAAQRSRKRFGGRIDYVSLIHLTYQERRHSTLFFFKQAELLHPFSVLKKDPLKSAYASYLCELVLKMLPEKEPDPFIFNLLKETLLGLEEANDDFKFEMRKFEWRFLKRLGLNLLLDHCIYCKGVAPSQVGWKVSFKLGGVLCSQCEKKVSHDLMLSHSGYIFLKELENPGDEPTQKEIEQLISLYLRYQNGYELKSYKYLKEIEKIFPHGLLPLTP